MAITDRQIYAPRIHSIFGLRQPILALNRIGVDYDIVGWSEIDRYAIKAHNALFPQYAERNYGDISRIDWANVPDFDLFTYSFPCTDISAAGQQKGFTEGSGTASASLWSRFSMAGLVLLAGEPIEEETWFEVFIATKIAGFALWGLNYLLHQYWNKRGLLPEEDYEDEFI